MYKFPKDSELNDPKFLFGVSTASYQIEGSTNVMNVALQFGILFVQSQAQYINSIMAMLHVTITTYISKMLT